MTKGTEYTISNPSYGSAKATTSLVDAEDIAEKFAPGDQVNHDPDSGLNEKADNSKVDVTVDPDTGNYVVKIKKNIDHTVEVPDTWGDETIDLNGNTIKGDNADENNAAKPGIDFKHGDSGKGTGTNLTIKDSSDKGTGTIKGGDGSKENPNGAAGIKGEDNTTDAKVTVNKPVKVIGGNGATGAADGGNGGSGIEDNVTPTINGGNGGSSESGSGGNNGQTGKMDYGTLTSTTNSVTVKNSKTGLEYKIYDKSGKEIGKATAAAGKDITFPDLAAGTEYTVKVMDRGTEQTVGTISTQRRSSGGSSGGGSTAPTKPTTPTKPDDSNNNQVADPDTTGVSNRLNTKNHDAYLSGYGNGKFGTNENMTRAQVAQMFYNLLSDKKVTISVDFSDVADNAWYAKAVNTLASLDVIKGVGDNKFAPDRSISRAEFAAIASRFAKASTSSKVSFSDVSTSAWYYDAVRTAVSYGWITGYSDGTFKPNATITRAEVTTITNRMLGRAADMSFITKNASSLKHFDDVSTTNWAYGQIMEATNGHSHSKTNGVENWSGIK